MMLLLLLGFGANRVVLTHNDMLVGTSSSLGGCGRLGGPSEKLLLHLLLEQSLLQLEPLFLRELLLLFFVLAILLVVIVVVIAAIGLGSEHRWS